jgi:hypothetical protein
MTPILLHGLWRTARASLYVAANVMSPGMGPTRQKLERMQIGTSATYGDIFPMAGPGAYTVRMTTHVPGQVRNTEVQFNYFHPR